MHLSDHVYRKVVACPYIFECVISINVVHVGFHVVIRMRDSAAYRFIIGVKLA